MTDSTHKGDARAPAGAASDAELPHSSQDHQEDQEQQDYVVGIHPVQALLEQAPERVVRLWLQSELRSSRLARIVELAKTAGIRVERAERQWLSQRAGAGVPHQGIVAMQTQHVLADESALRAHIANALEIDAAGVLILVLDELQDARNLGACLRCAEAAGVTAVVMPKRRAAPLNALARRTAAGAAESLFIAAVPNLVRVLKDLQSKGVWVYGFAEEGAQTYTAPDFAGPIAIVLGAEERGLRALVRTTCDGLVKIPMLGAVSSLNVAVATGIGLYEVVRQRADRQEN